MRFLVVTTSSRRARSEVLEASIRAHHPDAVVATVWCDARLGRRPGAGVLTPQRCDLGDLRWADLSMALAPRTAGWAALPWVLDELWDAEGRSPVVVLDDTFVALGPVDSLLAEADGSPMVRARHVDRRGVPWGGALPGLILLTSECDELLDWWRSRTIDAVTSAEELPDPWWSAYGGLSVSSTAAWRLTPSTGAEMELHSSPDGPLADGTRVTLVDFDGFDPRSPWWFAEAGADPSLLVSDSAALGQLCHDHAARLLDAGWTEGCDDDPDEVLLGVRFTPELRQWYRGLLAERDRESAAPNPFLSGDVDRFLGLLGGAGSPGGTGVSLHADLLYESRADLQRAFSQPRWRDRTNFRRWLWTSGLSEGQTSLATLPPPPRPVPAVAVTGERRPFGVNLAGYLGADLGLGVAARQMRRALECVGVPTSTISYDRTSSHLRSASSGVTDRPYHFNLMLIVPDQLPLFVSDVGAGFLSGHHNIGLWYWESDRLTEQQMLAFDHVDEVWTATTYLRDAFAAPGRVPVTLVPSPLVFDQPEGGVAQRHRLGLDDRFTFLFSFDFLSVVARKNPLGLVEAYTRAFAADAGTRLILKSINGDVFPRERERLLDAVASRPDIEVWDRLLSSADRLALVDAADCYVSLHRSEGLGLTMAEAMAVGTPVIATAYSGNLDFMDDRAVLLVPAEEVEVGEGNYYPPTGHWAEPDLDAAAESMRRMRDDADLRSRLVPAARAALAPFDHETVGRIARARLVEAW